MIRMSKNVDMSKYNADKKFGKRNQEGALKHLDQVFSAMLDKNIEVKEFGCHTSRFDYYIPNEKILIELKSRRCTYEDYPTQLLGIKKIESSRKNMKNGYRVFFAFLLQNKDDIDKMDLYMFEDELDNEYEIRILGNFVRNDKKTECCIVRNDDLTFISSVSF